MAPERRSNRTGALLSAALSLFGTGCEDDTAGAPCAYDICTITDASCVEEVARVVGCKRGEDQVTPTVRFLSSSELFAEWEAEREELTVEEERDMADWFRTHASIGLMPDGKRTTARRRR